MGNAITGARAASVAAAAVLLLGLAGCASESGAGAGGDGDSAPMGDLAGRTFYSTAVTQGGDPYALVADSRVTVTFTDGSLSANAGCNTLGGDASLTQGVLITQGSGLSMTEMGCDPPLMDQDTWLADILVAKPTVTLDDDTMTLTSGDIVIDFLDKETAEPDQPLTGTAWTLDSIGTTGADGSVSSIPSDVESTLQIDESGTMSVRPGCNTGRGAVEIGDTTVTFGPIALTKMACPDVQGNVETAVLKVLDGEVEYAIDGNRLTLTNDDSTLTYRVADAVQRSRLNGDTSRSQLSQLSRHGRHA